MHTRQKLIATCVIGFSSLLAAPALFAQATAPAAPAKGEIQQDRERLRQDRKEIREDQVPQHTQIRHGRCTDFITILKCFHANFHGELGDFTADIRQGGDEFRHRFVGA